MKGRRKRSLGCLHQGLLGQGSQTQAAWQQQRQQEQEQDREQRAHQCCCLQAPIQGCCAPALCTGWT